MLNNILNLKKILFILVFILGLVYSPQIPKAIDGGDVAAGVAAATAAYAVYSTTTAVTTPSIGGYTTWISTCTNPPAINFVSIQTAPPFVGSGSWMFVPGSVGFAYTGAPVHLDQPVLGKASISYLPCFTGSILTGPGGLVDLFSGSGA